MGYQTFGTLGIGFASVFAASAADGHRHGNKKTACWVVNTNKQFF